MSCRILHLITELNFGGAERLLPEVLPRLDRSKYEVQVAYLHGKAPLRAELEKNGIRVHALQSRRKYDPRPLWQLVQLLKKERIDILHTHLIQADILGYWAGCAAATPFVVSTKHNVGYYTRHPRWLRFMAKKIEGRVDAVIAVSAAVAAEFSHAKRLEVIHNGVDCEKFSPKPLPATGPMVCIASLTTQKGHRVLLEALSRIAPNYPDLHLELVGDGPLREDLKTRVRLLGLHHRVKFLGNVEDVRPVLERSTIMVLPSLWEGLGLVVMEAMAMNRPVIASAVDGIVEIIKNQRDGLLVPSGDIAALAKTIERLRRDPQLAERLAQEGRKRVVENFNLVEMTRQLDEFYQSLMAKH